MKLLTPIKTNSILIIGNPILATNQLTNKNRTFTCFLRFQLALHNAFVSGQSIAILVMANMYVLGDVSTVRVNVIGVHVVKYVLMTLVYVLPGVSTVR